MQLSTELAGLIKVTWGIAYLLVSNGELALGTVVLFRECLEFLDWLTLGDRCAEFDVLFGVFMARLYMKRLEVELHGGQWRTAEQQRQHTYTTVSSGSEARTSFNAVCISCAVPSKNRPHPK